MTTMLAHSQNGKSLGVEFAAMQGCQNPGGGVLKFGFGREVPP